MRYEIISLSESYPVLSAYERTDIGAPDPRVTSHGNTPRLFCYLHDVTGEITPARVSPAVIICPGGGYTMTSEREAEAIALRYFAHGYQAFVLRYSASAGWPVPLLEACGAIAYLRARSADYQIAPDKIAICGFSAGGHLAGSASTLWHLPIVSEMLGITERQGRPDASILCYPVLTSGEKAHRGSFENLLKEKANDPEMLALVSLEKQVRPDTPPAFLWHTANDPVVPVENTLLYATALSAHKIPFAVNIYPSGPHGMALADRDTNHPSVTHMIDDDVATWMDRSITWLNRLFDTQHMD